MKKSKGCCIGCHNNFYNKEGKTPDGIVRECWSYKNMKIIRANKIYSHETRNKTPHIVQVPNCYHVNHVFYRPV